MPAILLAIQHSLDMTLPSHALTWALFSVAFFSFLRKSNLLSPSIPTFDREPIKFWTSSCFLRTKWSKTRQHKEGIHIVPLPSIPHSSLCPVAAIHHYFSLVPATPDAPSFCLRSATSLTLVSTSFFTQPLSAWLASSTSLLRTILPTVSDAVVQLTLSKRGFPNIYFNFMATGVLTLTSVTCHFRSERAPR